jgi:hypothetical protein
MSNLLVELISLRRYSEAITNLQETFACKPETPSTEIWKAYTIQLLKNHPLPTNAQLQLQYYNCLKSCFHILQDLASELACWYQTISLSLETGVAFIHIATNLVAFANLCAEKGYLTQGIMVFFISASILYSHSPLFDHLNV